MVALLGRGFEAASWSIRTSPANLPDEAHPKVADAVHAPLDDLHHIDVQQEGDRR